MSYAYIRFPGQSDQEMVFVELIWITPTPGVPPRPTPGPTPPDPNAPHPEHPIWGPPGFGPGAGFPDRPGFPTIPFPPKPPGGGDPTGPSVALVFPMPVADPPVTPPAGIPPDSVQMVIWFGPGTKPTVAWVPPYADAAPPKPQEPAPQA
jgi:hypothetical protein